MLIILDSSRKNISFSIAENLVEMPILWDFKLILHKLILNIFQADFACIFYNTFGGTTVNPVENAQKSQLTFDQRRGIMIVEI